MDSELWSKFPTELLPHTLSFLSVPVLCRFQTVCKDWANLILKPEFLALCIKNGKANQFILVRCTIKNPLKSLLSESIGWRLLEVRENRWYNIEDPQHNAISFRFEQRSLAMDGGLACAYWEDVRTEDVKIFVSRPLEKTFDRLPASPYDGPFKVFTCDLVLQRVPAALTMVADHVNQGYKIFAMRSVLLDRRWSMDGGPCISVYESGTRKWRQSPTNLAGLTQLLRSPNLVRCTVVFQGLLYVLISDISEEGERWELWSYNDVEDSWNKIESEYHPSLLADPQLVVCGDKLFFASWSLAYLQEHLQPQVIKIFEVLEITPGQERSSKTLFHCSEDHMETVFETGFHKYTFEGVKPRFGSYLSDPYSCFPGSPEVAVFGLNDAIGLSARTTGISVKVDLVSGEWNWWDFAGVVPDEDLWFGPQPVNLIPHPRMFAWSHQKPHEVIWLDSDTDEDA